MTNIITIEKINQIKELVDISTRNLKSYKQNIEHPYKNRFLFESKEEALQKLEKITYVNDRLRIYYLNKLKQFNQNGNRTNSIFKTRRNGQCLPKR